MNLSKETVRLDAMIKRLDQKYDPIDIFRALATYFHRTTSRLDGIDSDVADLYHSVARDCNSIAHKIEVRDAKDE